MPGGCFDDMDRKVKAEIDELLAAAARTENAAHEATALALAPS